MEWQRLWTDETAVVSVDTALLFIMVSLVALATWQHLAHSAFNMATSASDHITETSGR